MFRTKPPVDPDEFEWLVACFAWLHRHLGGLKGDTGFSPVLVLSDTPEIRDAASASALFEGVKRLAGLSEWHCVLEQGNPPQDALPASHLGAYSTRHALGTFSVEGNSPVIRYDPELLRNPEALAATFAHELGHLLIHSLGMPPGGEELEEHATDCAAVYMGFGVFLANSARQFSQFQDGLVGGWSSSWSGYLSERALVTATALFIRLNGCAPDGAIDSLKPYLRKDFRTALKYIDRHHPDVAETLERADISAWAA